jgi:small subunit ribosomal protein S8
MAYTDPISDMLTRIRNGHHALHRDVFIPHSKVKLAIAEILKDEGYISQYAEEDQQLKVTLKYTNGKPNILGLKKVSKPGRRVYVGAADIPRVQNGLGICIISTSQGILEGSTAHDKNVGGELLCEIW